MAIPFSRSTPLLVLLLVCNATLKSQTWIPSPCLESLRARDHSAFQNFYQLQQAYYACAGTPTNVMQADEDMSEFENETHNQFKRWEWYNEPRVYPSGEFPRVDFILAEHAKFVSQHTNVHQRQLANWANLTSPSAPTGYMSAGVGRVNCLAFMPGNDTILFAGAACGGVWKSLDGGDNWSALNTDQLPSLSITSIVIDPTDTDKIYIATGDNFTGFPISGVLKQGHFSAGIFKSTNGGLTWTLAGMPMEQEDGFIPQQLILDPVTPSTLLLAANTGIWRSIDSGSNWTQVNSSGFFYSIEFNPLNSNVVFATNGLGLWRSNNNGQSWTYKGGGYPNMLGGRVSLAVTPADTNYVYIWGPTPGFKRSTEGGSNLVTMANPASIAQPYGYVDRALGVSKTNALDVLAGGLITAKSDDGGASWYAVTDWQDTTLSNWVHADIKKIIYAPGSGTTLYLVNDGGISVSADNAVTWTDISDGLQISEIYKIANSPFGPDTIYYGAQDAGTYRWDATASLEVLSGGDGFQPLVNPTNGDILFASHQIGNLKKSFDAGESFVSASPGQYLWNPPIKMNPLNPQTMYVGCTAGVKKSTVGGTQGSYINMSAPWLANIIAMDVTKADTQYIYAASKNQMIRSSDGGSTWVYITAGLPVDSAAISYITVSTVNPLKVYVTFSGYALNQKVYMSSDGGNVWNNISGTLLPNVPVNCITYMDGSYDGVYIGTDFGVFYRDAASADWIAYNAGLPNVIVNHLAIQYEFQKIRAGTYGRGLWESDLATNMPAVMIWVGNISADWNNPLNWNPHGVPIFSQDVIIPEVFSPNYYPVVNVTGLTCKNLTIHPLAMMTIPAGKVFRTSQ